MQIRAPGTWWLHAHRHQGVTLNPVQTLHDEPLKAKRHVHKTCRRLPWESCSQRCGCRAAHVGAPRAVPEVPNESPPASPKNRDGGRAPLFSPAHGSETTPALFLLQRLTELCMELREQKGTQTRSVQPGAHSPGGRSGYLPR